VYRLENQDPVRNGTVLSGGGGRGANSSAARGSASYAVGVNRFFSHRKHRLQNVIPIIMFITAQYLTDTRADVCMTEKKSGKKFIGFTIYLSLLVKPKLSRKSSRPPVQPVRYRQNPQTVPLHRVPTLRCRYAQSLLGTHRWYSRLMPMIKLLPRRRRLAFNVPWMQ
jgi:hypothetical protein